MVMSFLHVGGWQNLMTGFLPVVKADLPGECLGIAPSIKPLSQMC
jgi:hypothetical protein